MGNWYQGTLKINCHMEDVLKASEDISYFFLSTTQLMPGITSADIMDSHNDVVVIKTNEGIMTRTNITVKKLSENIAITYDESYIASNITVHSNVEITFSSDSDAVSIDLSINDVVSRGILGFFYIRFGKKNIGHALMKSFKAYLDR